MSTTASVALATATTVGLWASAFVAVRVAVPELPPGPLALVRTAVAVVVLAPWCWTRRQGAVPRGDLPRLALAGGLGFALYGWALHGGQRTVSAGVASVLINTVPLWTAVLAMACLGERVSGRAWWAAAVAFVGVVLLAVGGGEAAGSPAGMALVLGAALAQAGYFVLTKPVVGRGHPLVVTWLAMVAGLLWLLPCVPAALRALDGCSARALGAAAFLGVGPGALAYAAWAFVLRAEPAARASRRLFAVPVVALLLGVVLLGERPTLLGGCGVALVWFGVLGREERER